MAFRRAWLPICVLWVLTSSGTSQSTSSNPPQQAGVPGTPSTGSVIPAQQSDLSLNWNDLDRRVWANAKTYVDLPLHEVMAVLPDLKGLAAEKDTNLTSLLERVGKSCLDLLQHTPSVASREDQITTQKVASRISGGAFEPDDLLSAQERQTFGYLLLPRVTGSGVELREYRTDKKGRPVANSGSKMGQVSEGFVSEWLRLFPGNQSQSRFRYLGRQDVDGRKAFVIAFAEIPERVKFPTIFSLDGRRVTMLFQGIAWVDASDFRILRLREDLLAPRPDLQLEKMSVKLRFGDVHLAKAESTLWLPQEADVIWEYKGMAGEQKHLYSDFRLYAVHSKIVPQ